jgi:hypothetical protein
VIEAKEERDVMICDIPNAFIQAYLPKNELGEDIVVMPVLVGCGVTADTMTLDIIYDCDIRIPSGL